MATTVRSSAAPRGGYDPHGPHCLRMPSGEVVDLAAPAAETIRLGDVALALSHVCRFGGSIVAAPHYSVAEHCSLVHDLLAADGHPEPVLRAGLLHDAHEAYLGDVIRPLKPLLGDAYAALADAMDRAIGEALDVDPALFTDPRVAAADDLALAIEAPRLAPRDLANRRRPVGELPADVQWHAGLSADAAAHGYVTRLRGVGLAVDLPATS